MNGFVAKKEKNDLRNYREENEDGEL